MKRFWTRSAIAAVLLACTAGSASADTRVYVQIGPPRAVVEQRVVRPAPDYVWVRGYHAYDGDHHYWVAGHWEQRPRYGVRWVDGRWRHNRSGWYWTDGRWR